MHVHLTLSPARCSPPAAPQDIAAARFAEGEAGQVSPENETMALSQVGGPCAVTPLFGPKLVFIRCFFCETWLRSVSL